MSPLGFEPTISAGVRPQTHALDRAAAGTGADCDYVNIFKIIYIYIYISEQQNSNIYYGDLIKEIKILYVVIL